MKEITVRLTEDEYKHIEHGLNSLVIDYMSSCEYGPLYDEVTPKELKEYKKTISQIDLLRIKLEQAKEGVENANE